MNSPKEKLVIANGRLGVVNACKSSVLVDIYAGEHTGFGFISIKNFLYLLENPDAKYEIQVSREHLGRRRLMNGDVIEVTYPETRWVCPYKPSRF